MNFTDLMLNLHIGKDVKIKAAGGIASFADAQEFIFMGADRIGASRLIKIIDHHINL